MASELLNLNVLLLSDLIGYWKKVYAESQK